MAASGDIMRLNHSRAAHQRGSAHNRRLIGMARSGGVKRHQHRRGAAARQLASSA